VTAGNDAGMWSIEDREFALEDLELKYSGDTAFRDRNAGRQNNRSKPTDEAEQPTRRGERRGGGRGDRQSRTGQT